MVTTSGFHFGESPLWAALVRAVSLQQGYGCTSADSSVCETRLSDQRGLKLFEGRPAVHPCTSRHVTRGCIVS